MLSVMLFQIRTNIRSASKLAKTHVAISAVELQTPAT